MIHSNFLNSKLISLSIINSYFFLLGTFFISCDSKRTNQTEIIDPKFKYTKISDNLQKTLRFQDSLNTNRINNIELTEALISQFEFKYNNDILINDSTYLKDLFLKKNEALSKSALQESSWHNEIGNQDYFEFIMPYKLTFELTDNWREILYKKHQNLKLQNSHLENLDSLYKYHMTNTYNELQSTSVFQNKFPSVNNFQWLYASKEGDCNDRCNYVIYHMRAAGAPATFDIIPSWGNRPYSKHSFVGLANRETQVPALLENTNDPDKLVDLLNAAMYPPYIYHFKNDEVPENLTVQYEKTIPKVYRRTWNPQLEKLNSIAKIPLNERVSNILDPYLIDVTEEYLKTSTVEISKNILNGSNIAYLSTFDINGWIPVSYAIYDWKGNATFSKVGKNILYLPIIKYDKFEPSYGTPFILNNDGEKVLLKGSNETQEMILSRKYPLFCYTANHTLNFKGLKIEGSNDKDYVEATTLFKIDYYPFYTQKLKINSSDKFQYIRLKSGSSEPFRLAELKCFVDSLGITINKEDKLSKSGALDKTKWNNCFDNDLNSYVSATEIRMNLGKKYKISKIEFTPRNDTNNIIPNKLYELFYWKNGWVSAGSKRALKSSLKFSNIPKNTVYWLRCLTDGSEERIFTYENNKQVWW